MSEELPEGWATCGVGEVFRSFGGGTPDRSVPAYWNGKIPWLSSGDIKSERLTHGSEWITDAGVENSSARLCRPGSVLVVVRSGILKHTLPVAVLECEAAINQDLKCFDSGNAELNQWLALALRCSEEQILAMNREGTTVQSVKYETLCDFRLRVPPLPEQHRIVAKLEHLLGKLEVCQRRLAKVPTLLKRFRQSVLAAACSGRLTADWRDQTLVPATRNEADSDDLLPDWKTACVADVAENLKYGTAQKCSYDRVGVPVLRIPNIAEGIVDHSDLKFAELPTSEFAQLRLRVGDLLLIRSNGSVALIGRCALVREEERDFAYAGYLIRIRPKQDVVDPEFLTLAFGSHEVRLQIEIGARSTSGVNNINSEEVRALRFSLPPLPEQHEIVRRVQSLFALADQIEARHARARAFVDRLAPSLLARAFRGELVPTEAALAAAEGRSYEPASALLARLAAEREAAPSKAIHKRPRTPKQLTLAATDAP